MSIIIPAYGPQLLWENLNDPSHNDTYCYYCYCTPNEYVLEYSTPSNCYGIKIAI